MNESLPDSTEVHRRKVAVLYLNFSLERGVRGAALPHLLPSAARSVTPPMDTKSHEWMKVRMGYGNTPGWIRITASLALEIESRTGFQPLRVWQDA
jgi:hypothetical protein